MSLMNRLFRAVRQGSIDAGRTRARQHLLARGDRFLADNGFSRELLERGNRAWPWRVEASVAAIRLPPIASRGDSAVRSPFGTAPIAVETRLADAFAELDAMSDVELRDLGIQRPDIVEAVRHGRRGVEREAAGEAA